MNIYRLFSGYLRWIAETSVMVFNQAQTFHWACYGLKVHIPQGALPAGLNCKLLIKVGLSGQFTFPQNTSLVSAVYCIDSEPQCKFSKPLTLEMQHCAQSSQTSRLSFARCSHNSPPYAFEILEGGEFSSQSAYGRIQLHSFSLIIQLLSRLPWLARIFGDDDEDVKYHASLYYLMKRVDRREIHFLITKDLDAYATVCCFCFISSHVPFIASAYYHRKFDGSTLPEVPQLDQACQLSLTLEIKSHCSHPLRKMDGRLIHSFPPW